MDFSVSGVMRQMQEWQLLLSFVGHIAVIIYLLLLLLLLLLLSFSLLIAFKRYIISEII